MLFSLTINLKCCWLFILNMAETNRHEGDCTIYSSLENGNPEDGICTCGYGFFLLGKGDYSAMYSGELEQRLVEGRRGRSKLVDGVGEDGD
jgi:hypothetical protein